MNPFYTNSNGNTSLFPPINQQWSTSSCFYNHENPIFKPNNIQSTIDKPSNNGKFVVAADSVNCFNNSVILKKTCLTDGRSSKKDRHSKINTARGLRDRRMRLSVDVAKKFFELQDMLGFDKASNTIEWLIMKSKPAIRDLRLQKLNQSCCLMGVSNSQSSASDCEVLSGIDDQSMEKIEAGKVIIKQKKQVRKGVRRSVYIDRSLAKETREKARARARKRTTEKKQIKLGPSSDQVMDQNPSGFGSWIPFTENQVQITDQAGYLSAHHGIVGDSSTIPSSNIWSPSFLFNHHHNLGLFNEILGKS